jgi:hypothetical protein
MSDTQIEHSEKSSCKIRIFPPYKKAQLLIVYFSTVNSCGSITRIAASAKDLSAHAPNR